MEALLIVVVIEDPDPPVRQHAVTVHQEQLDARGTSLNVSVSHRLHEYRSANFKQIDTRQLQTRRRARQQQHCRA